jgi:hypothetical protein
MSSEHRYLVVICVELSRTALHLLVTGPCLPALGAYAAWLTSTTWPWQGRPRSARAGGGWQPWHGTSCGGAFTLSLRAAALLPSLLSSLLHGRYSSASGPPVLEVRGAYWRGHCCRWLDAVCCVRDQNIGPMMRVGQYQAPPVHHFSDSFWWLVALHPAVKSQKLFFFWRRGQSCSSALGDSECVAALERTGDSLCSILLHLTRRQCACTSRTHTRCRLPSFSS